MIQRISKDKVNLVLMKEVGYVLLLLTFFVGVIIGAFSLKNVDSNDFNAYSESINSSLNKINSKEQHLNSTESFYNGVKIIAIYWIVGMSVIGTPILMGYLGYKGYSLGYTISSIIRILGAKSGNLFAFKYLFLKNAILVFIMIFLANFSIKISKNFFEKKNNLKIDVVKYTAFSGITLVIWIGSNLIEKMIL